MNADLTDALAFRSRLHEASRLVQALEGCEARNLAQLRETRASLRDSRKKLDQLIRGDAAPCPLFDRPTPAIAELVPNVCVADISASPSPVLPPKKLSSAELASQQLDSYPGWWGQENDRTGEVERRMVEHRRRAIPEAPTDVINRESIIAWRGRASAGDTTPQWEGWCEFGIDLGDGLTAEVLYEGPEKFLTRGTMKFWSAWVSETGFCSWTPFVPHTPAEGESLLAYATRIGLHLKAEETVAREKRCAKARRERKKAEAKENGSKVYAWDVTYTRSNFEGDVTVTIVAKTEAQARRKALLRPNAREVIRLEGMTEEQYRRVHGSRRKRV